ncbi:hypothetical protein J4H92_02045 [Leucobacter weissii]|uniref:Uncharacterized protein n=1 Tax=Leucobacter weissii TaxID=1983706 RepID=A0A939MHC1_9MICO|nr:hypothetical protein [Leucobacter weissii]MBO1900728.1 hypothetical protein [Leucobacter weissii]
MLECLFSQATWSITRTVQRRDWRREVRRGVFPCGVRVLSGRQTGFATREWRTGMWRIDPKLLTFEGASAGERPLSFETAEIDVLELVPGSRRDAKSAEELGLYEATVVRRIRTETAELEWSTPAMFAAAAIRALHARA